MQPSNPRRVLAGILLAAFIALIGCAVCGATIARPLAAPLYNLIRNGWDGPDIAFSAISPDAQFEAYVVEKPALDPPDQDLLIQRTDGIHFVVVAQLVADVDRVLDIRWSPNSDLVLFICSNNLFAVRLPGYQTVKIPLDTEFARYKPGKFTTFGGGIPKQQVSEVDFPEPGVFVYSLEGLSKNLIEPGVDERRTVRMDDLLGLAH
jgi:hypothetical protein